MIMKGLDRKLVFACNVSMLRLVANLDISKPHSQSFKKSQSVLVNISRTVKSPSQIFFEYIIYSNKFGMDF